MMNFKDIKNEIKWAYQRVKYGYDETIKWGFEDYFNIAIKPLKEFCQEQLLDEEDMKLNPERREIYTETLNKISAFEKMSIEDEMMYQNKSSELYKFFSLFNP